MPRSGPHCLGSNFNSVIDWLRDLGYIALPPPESQFPHLWHRVRIRMPASQRCVSDENRMWQVVRTQKLLLGVFRNIDSHFGPVFTTSPAFRGNKQPCLFHLMYPLLLPMHRVESPTASSVWEQSWCRVNRYVVYITLFWPRYRALSLLFPLLQPYPTQRCWGGRGFVVPTTSTPLWRNVTRVEDPMHRSPTYLAFRSSLFQSTRERDETKICFQASLWFLECHFCAYLWLSSLQQKQWLHCLNNKVICYS